MIKQIKEALERKGIKSVLGKDDSIRFATDGYNVAFYEEERNCLAYFDPINPDKTVNFGYLRFTTDGEEDPKISYALILTSDLTPDEISSWIYNHIQNPERDPITLKELEEIKSRVKALNIKWLMKDERSIHISNEIEEYEKIKISSVVVNYNDIMSNDHMMFQIKTLLDQPGCPKLYLFKNINLGDKDDKTVMIREQEFDIKDIEGIVKRTIMLRYLDLEEIATQQDGIEIQKRSESL